MIALVQKTSGGIWKAWTEEFFAHYGNTMEEAQGQLIGSLRNRDGIQYTVDTWIVLKPERSVLDVFRLEQVETIIPPPKTT